jgi:hypothetical protein
MSRGPRIFLRICKHVIKKGDETLGFYATSFIPMCAILVE